jgi:hypothetical protein
MLKTSFVFSALLWCLAGSPATAATCVTVYPGMCVMLDTNSYEAMPVPESRGTSACRYAPRSCEPEPPHHDPVASP